MSKSAFPERWRRGQSASWNWEIQCCLLSPFFYFLYPIYPHILLWCFLTSGSQVLDFMTPSALSSLPAAGYQSATFFISL